MILENHGLVPGFCHRPAFCKLVNTLVESSKITNILTNHVGRNKIIWDTHTPHRHVLLARSLNISHDLCLPDLDPIYSYFPAPLSMVNSGMISLLGHVLSIVEERDQQEKLEN